MKAKIIFTLSLLLILETACQKQDEMTMDPAIIQLNAKGKNLINSSSGFGIDLFKKVVNTENEGKNLMISPFSISLALVMTYNGANGDTKTAMENVLHLNNLSTEEININFKQITDALLNLDGSVNLSIANSIWYRNDLSVLPDFININKNFYNAEVSSLDFNSPSAKNTINNWVAEKTNNKIPSIIDQIDAQTVMYLINAIYFKGMWKYKFDKSKNFSSTFFLSNGTTKPVEMMQQETNFGKYSNTLMSMVEMPFGRGNWAMDLILPRQGKKVEDVLNELSVASWNEWTSSLSDPSKIQITLPAFKFEYEKSLKDILSEIGMSVAFNPNLADFSKINSSEQLFISEVKHKTFVEVNEEGAEAVAATSVGMSAVSIGDGIVFNRPFLFVIREISTGTILFIGKVENPER